MGDCAGGNCAGGDCEGADCVWGADCSEEECGVLRACGSPVTLHGNLGGRHLHHIMQKGVG